MMGVSSADYRSLKLSSILRKPSNASLRRSDYHLPSRGEYPAVEIAAEIDRCLHCEMVLIHDLRGNILPEAVDDAVHEGVFAQQHNTARFAGKHEKSCVKYADTSKGSFLRDPQPVDAVYLELYDLQPTVVEADKIVGVIVPKWGIYSSPDVTSSKKTYLHFTVMLNNSGEDAQSRRNKCSISAV